MALKNIFAVLIGVSFTVSGFPMGAPPPKDTGLSESEKFALFAAADLAGGLVGGKCQMSSVHRNNDSKIISFALTDLAGASAYLTMGMDLDPAGQVSVERITHANGDTEIEMRDYLSDQNADCGFLGCDYKLFDFRETFVIGKSRKLVGYKQTVHSIKVNRSSGSDEVTRSIDCRP